MKIIFLILILFQGGICQSQSTKFLLFEKRDLDKNRTSHLIGYTQELVFRVYNYSQNSLTIYGNEDEKEFSPEIDTLTWNPKIESWLFSSGKETPVSIDEIKPEGKYTLKSRQFLEFKVWMQIPCFASKRKLAIYIKSESDEIPKVILSNEFTVQNLSGNCSTQR